MVLHLSNEERIAMGIFKLDEASYLWEKFKQGRLVVTGKNGIPYHIIGEEMAYIYIVKKVDQLWYEEARRQCFR